MVTIEAITKAIKAYYSHQTQVSDRLVESILYSVDAGGKRVRPRLLLDTLEGFGLTVTPSHYAVAASLEMVHTGSLIHDDLPAMDDDDYRRGQLTNHKQFDEATAILAGDALFLDPFAVITETDLSDKVKVQLIKELSLASGSYGMVGGQMLDMQGEHQTLSLSELCKIHANKTGKLLTFPFVAAGLIAEQSEGVINSLRQIGELVGLAFQVRDDLLDVTASFEELGKTPKKDLSADKSTYPSLLGIPASYAFLEDTLNQAIERCRYLEQTTEFQAEHLITLIERLRLHA